MKKVSIPNIQTDSQAQNQSQAYQNQATRTLASGPLSTGIILSSISLTTGANSVSHKLGNKLQGWIVVRKRSAADIYDQQDSNPTPAQTISLYSSASVTVDLFVF